MRPSTGSDTGSRRKRKISLRVKLFLIILAVTLTCVVFFAVLSNYLVRRQFDRVYVVIEQEFVQPLSPPPPEPPDIAHMKNERLMMVNLSYAFTGLLGILLAFFLSWYISDRISRPLSELTMATASIAGGEFGKQVEVKGGKEVEELATAFNDLSLRLERNEVLRKNMITDISHELRNPLAAQRGYLEALQDGVIDLKPEAIEVILKNNILLARLVEDLRQLSLLDAGQIELDIMPVDIKEVLRTAASSFEHHLTEKGISLELNMAGDLKAVKADWERTSQILHNLLANAIQYTPDGGSITLGARSVQQWVIITVSDSGRGIEEAELPFVFERFYRTDKSRTRDTGGTGLGLSIARGLVEAQGGRIWAESEPGKGTTISFTLPSQA